MLRSVLPERFSDDDDLLFVLSETKISLRPYTSGYSAPWNKEAHVMMCPP